MSELRRRMLTDLRIRSYAERTQEIYVGRVAEMAVYFNRSPQGLSREDVRGYLRHLKEDPLSITLDDPDHSSTEQRFLLLGRAATDRLLIVAIAKRDDAVRIISARLMTRRERRAHEQQTGR
ncbi:MAG: BrnT family toxin [Gemmatimonadetes bacterium]|nr:BrnT family toxin [Gemmatimonadota bacterium]